MSLKKSDIRRLGLMAGSSLAAATLSAFVLAAPSAAFAANECGDPGANGASADVFTCATPPTYATGVDYSTTTNGNLTLFLQNRFDTGTAGTGGIRMFGKTGESMTLLRDDSTAGAGDPRVINTAGRAIDVTTLGAGAVLLNLTDGDPTSEASVNATTGTAPIRITGSTDAIRAEALGTGAVTVTFASTGTASGVNHPLAVISAGAGVGSNGSGILARSTTGAINIDSRGATFTINTTNGGSAIEAVSTSGAVTITAGAAVGRLRGILAQTGGAGVVNVTSTSNVNAASAAAGGLAGIDTVAGTGATSIAITAGSVSGGGGAAIRAVSASTSATAVTVQNTGGTVSGRINFSGVTAGGTSFSNTGASATTGRWTATGASVFSPGADTLTMSGVGANTMAAASSFDFGAGNDTFSMGALLTTTSASMDFGTGTDTFNLSGALTMDGLTVANLETLNLSGGLYMGARNSSTPSLSSVTDLTPDDVFVMTGGTFTGSGSGRVVMDILPGLGRQDGCATLTLGDCLDLRGASTAGLTRLTLNDVNSDLAVQAGYDSSITLVDVGGAGTSAAGHFIIDPNTVGYADDATYGGTISRPGLFVFALQYDPAAQRHNLVGLPRRGVMEYVVVGGAAQSIWHMTSQAVTNRQTDIRRATDGGALWLRASGDYTKRNMTTVLETPGGDIDFDNSYRLYAGSVIGGLDLFSGTSGGYDYVVGAQLGYVGSSFSLDASDGAGRFTGATGGLYASVWNGRYFLDTTFNSNFLALDYEQPGLGATTNTYLYSFGAQAEGGFRGMLTEHLYAEPLATIAFVRTTFEEISLAGGKVLPDAAESLRAAIGLRIGADVTGGPVNISYFVTGRAWDEQMGDTGAVIRNPGADLILADTFDGAFGELEAGVNMFNLANTLSGFITSGVKIREDYEAVNLSAGVRMRW